MTWVRRVISGSLMLLVSGITFALIGVQSVEASTINFAADGGAPGATIEFTGTGDTFTFTDSSSLRDFIITTITGGGFTLLPGLKGNIGGIFTIGAITTSGLSETAPVTGAGTFSINDGAGFTFSAVLTWVDIVTFGTGGIINATGTVNLSSFVYNGVNADLLALLSSTGGTLVSTFQFIPGLNLTALTADGAFNSTSHSGSLTPVPEPVCGDGLIAGGEQCDDGNTTSGDGCSSSCQVEAGYQCSGSPSVCQLTTNECAFANPALGAQASSLCSILNDGGKVDISGSQGEIQGNICIGQNGKVSMSGGNFVTNPGEVILEPGASCNGCSAARVPGGVVTNADLTPEIDACNAARAANTPPAFGGTGPACTETIRTLQSITVNGVISRTGTNVICITDQKEVKKDIRLTGDATTKYIFVVKGKFKYNQAKVVTDCTPPLADPAACTAAGVGPDDVLWLFVGTNQELSSSGGGGGAGCCNAVLDGSVIIDGKIALSPGLINGQVCGTGGWALTGGSGVHCPDP